MITAGMPTAVISIPNDQSAEVLQSREQPLDSPVPCVTTDETFARFRQPDRAMSNALAPRNHRSLKLSYLKYEGVGCGAGMDGCPPEPRPLSWMLLTIAENCYDYFGTETEFA